MDRRNFIKKGSIGFAIFSMAPTSLLATSKMPTFELRAAKKLLPHIRHGLLNLNLLEESLELGPSWLKHIQVNHFYKTGFKTNKETDLIRNYSILIKDRKILESIQIKLEMDELMVLNNKGLHNIHPSKEATLLYQSTQGELKLYYLDQGCSFFINTHEKKTHLSLLKGTAKIELQALKAGDQLSISSEQEFKITIEAGSAFVIDSENCTIKTSNEQNLNALSSPV